MGVGSLATGMCGEADDVSIVGGVVCLAATLVRVADDEAVDVSAGGVGVMVGVAVSVTVLGQAHLWWLAGNTSAKFTLT
jgi:hypothetical protein